MFKLLEEVSETYTWPVTAKVPGNGGKVITLKFDAEFRRLPASRMRDLMRGKDEMVEGEKPKTVIEVVDEVLVGVNYKGDEGKEFRATDDEKDDLLAVLGVDVAIYVALLSSFKGEKAKN